MTIKSLQGELTQRMPENEASMAMVVVRSNRSSCCSCFLSLPPSTSLSRIISCFAASIACALSAYALLLISDSSSSNITYLPLLSDLHYSLSTVPPPSLLSPSPSPVASCLNHSLPRSLRHSWSDEYLLQRAIDSEKRNLSLSAASNDSFPACLSSRRRYFNQVAAPLGHGGSKNSKKPWKVAFLFLTRGPLPFAPLWERFFHGHEAFFNVYIHLDPFDAEAFESKLLAGSVFCGRLIPSFPTERGAPSLAAAERRLLANALLDDPLNLYFAILSDHCIPLRSFHGVYDYLVRQAEGKSFIEILSDAPTLRGRYDSRGGESAMLPEVPLQRFRVGSQFFVLNREHAMSVVEDVKIWRKFTQKCSDMFNCYTEEHYFPTFVDMEVKDAGNCVEPRTLTHVQWFFPNDGHPRTFTAEQVNAELISSLRSKGNFLFARKFTDDSLLPLFQLSSFILEESYMKKP